MAQLPSVDRTRIAPIRRAVLGLALVVSVVLVAGCDGATLVPTETAPGTTSVTTATPTSLETEVAAPSPTFVRPTPTPEPTFVAYVVASGDTLTAIARRFATTARSIAYWNRATYPSLDPDSPTYEPDRIEAGWTLRVIPGVEVDEQDLPSPSPTALPTVSIAPGPTPATDGTSLLISHGSRDSNAIALTFDMGGRLDPALSIMGWLVDHDIRATVFPTGKAGSETAIGREVMARIAAHPELFAVGNHSWDHPDFRQLTAVQIADQLERTEAALAPLVGQTTKPFFRPPDGSTDDAARTAVGAAGWPYTVLWDVDTIDWRAPSDGGPTADDIVAKVVSRARGGSIVLMHLGGWTTLEALPRIVDGLRARGLEPVTLTELLGS
jgi:peptidoglycan/xylan/chitin deacetylase (PgdA/CDA1 family)